MLYPELQTQNYSLATNVDHIDGQRDPGRQACRRAERDCAVDIVEDVSEEHAEGVVATGRRVLVGETGVDDELVERAHGQVCARDAYAQLQLCFACVHLSG